MIYRPFKFFLERRLAGVGAAAARGSVATTRASVDPGESRAGGHGVLTAPHGVRAPQAAPGPASTSTGRSAGPLQAMRDFDQAMRNLTDLTGFDVTGWNELVKGMRREAELAEDRQRQRRLRVFNTAIRVELEHGR